MLQAPDMSAPNVIEVLHTPWTSWGALLTCDLNPRQAEACQYIAALSLPELAAMRKVISAVLSQSLQSTYPFGKIIRSRIPSCL